MLLTVVRGLKRFFLLLPGLALAYFGLFEIYPDINKRLPAAIAIVITYIVTAYVLIPASTRLVRIVLRPKHIPLYCVTPDGFASDPVNIGLIGTRTQVVRAMQKAGWFLADKRTAKTILKLVVSFVLKQPYPSAPFSNLYLFGRRQDLGFEISAGSSVDMRHHVRFWASEPTMSSSERQHLQFWQRHSPSKVTSQRQLWVGAASLDTGLAFIRHNAQITHMIHPDTNAERDLIVSSLKKTGLVSKTRTLTVGKPYRLINRVWRGFLHSDGKMTICTLKVQTSRTSRPAN